MTPSRTTRILLSVASGLLFVVVVAGLRVGMAYWSIDRDEFDPDAARDRIDAAGADVSRGGESDADGTGSDSDPPFLADLDFEIADDGLSPEKPDAGETVVLPDMSSPPLPDGMFTAYTLIGADLSGYLADTIILVLLPYDGSVPILASLPRDLYLPTPCGGSYSRINSTLGGCKGVASGPELLSLTIEDFTGISVDHFAMVGFSGFTQIIDVLGGVQVCVDYPTRDIKAGLDIEAGCTQADGATTLAWVRSRQPEQLVDGEWGRVTGASDFSRQSHQHDVLMQLFSRMTSFGSLTSLGEVAQQVASSTRLDSAFSIGDAVSLAWSYRNVDSSSLKIVRLSYEDYRTADGAQVLLPSIKFAEALAKVYPAVSG